MATYLLVTGKSALQWGYEAPVLRDSKRIHNPLEQKFYEKIGWRTEILFLANQRVRVFSHWSKQSKWLSSMSRSENLEMATSRGLLSIS